MSRRTAVWSFRSPGNEKLNTPSAGSVKAMSCSVRCSRTVAIGSAAVTPARLDGSGDGLAHERAGPVVGLEGLLGRQVPRELSGLADGTPGQPIAQRRVVHQGCQCVGPVGRAVRVDQQATSAVVDNRGQ